MKVCPRQCFTLPPLQAGSNVSLLKGQFSSFYQKLPSKTRSTLIPSLKAIANQK
ncbi:MAG: hypothetical protein F6K41_19860 [Symploca sp. SIO3E6]|nr:hypothetical protein [Caldora sp. SIO3E6]